jgi:enamine deaminase RidA (YjgF/YER057c/UK114 family)
MSLRDVGLIILQRAFLVSISSNCLFPHAFRKARRLSPPWLPFLFMARSFLNHSYLSLPVQEQLIYQIFEQVLSSIAFPNIYLRLRDINMANRQPVVSDKVMESPLLSQAMIHGNTVFCSGNIGLDPKTGEVVEGTVADRTRRALLNIEAVLEEAGSSLQKMLKVANPARIHRPGLTEKPVQHLPDEHE